MDFLHMSRDHVQAWAQSAMPSPADKITVGAAVAYYLGVFEVPGVKVNESDTSIWDALAREVAEEMDLTVSRILNSLEPFTYTTEKQAGERLPIQSIQKVALQLSYLVEVHRTGDDFVVNPDDHSEGTWATADRLSAIPITDEMRKNVLEGLSSSA
ncbi:hypothetical protein EDB80DRAFT_891886 [Ilyonectria destructans]|nr:hypothetical protein EDB80DRAFT_891886 [Ilyonectria destructans]